mgnify:CR=1 FL=1
MNTLTIDDLINVIKKYNPEEVEIIKKAYYYAEELHKGQKRQSGEDYITHPLNVAYILASMHADRDTVCAGLLHDTLEDTHITKEDISHDFNPVIASLVDGVTKINKLNFTSDSEASAANQRKILVGLSEDPRVIIIKLADRLHNMRTINVLSVEKQKKKARETLEILTPVAHRLGIYKIKSELEDLSLRYLKPDAYFDIVEKLNQKKTLRDEAVSKMISEVSTLLNEHNIPHEIKGRSKSIYSIYNKMAKGKRFDDIYDILALRVFVDTEQDCYLALGLIHSKYKPVPKRFKDYIAMPKTNLYQSLHTTVFGLDGNLFEIQIRTYEMDKIAEYGIASHWSYKEHKDGEKSAKDAIEQKLQIFRNIIELNEESNNPEEFISSVKKDILTNDVIYVYTPKGDVIELPKDSTPVDFAYKVHSEVGDHIVGAIVNDNIVTLDYKLKTGDIIKVNLGYNIGNELGGLHYCVVINKFDNPFNGTLNVIPLTSKKENKKYHKSCVSLGSELYNILSANIEKENDKLNNLLSELDKLDNIPEDFQEAISKKMKYLEKLGNEINKLKLDSIALITQITTISKQRIYDDIILRKVRLSTNSLNVIDKKINYYFTNQKEQI